MPAVLEEGLEGGVPRCRQGGALAPHHHPLPEEVQGIVASLEVLEGEGVGDRAPEEDAVAVHVNFFGIGLEGRRGWGINYEYGASGWGSCDT